MFQHLKKLFLSIMSKKSVFQDSNYLVPPSVVRGMTILDRNAFESKFEFPAVMVPVNVLRQCKKLLRRKLPRLNMKAVVAVPGDEKHKLVLLHPQAKLDADDFSKLKELGVEKNIIYKEIKIGYEHFQPRDIFRAVFPANLDNNDPIPKGFAQIGHIIHLNLRAHHLPFRHLIGQVFLDKVPSAKTVVNKLENVTNLYRTLDMELLAGEANFQVRHAEHHLLFDFDFSKVFWNSCLSSEHHRISTLIPATDTVFDACAGVGPFSIPLAKKGCRVFANDLNPDCHRWMVHNVKINKVKTMECYNLDGREFIKNVFRKHLEELNDNTSSTIHVLMNLPAIAVEFLDAFSSLLSRAVKLPEIKVYFYIFAEADYKGTNEIEERVTKHLGVSLPLNADIHQVRSIAPSKDQYCVSFPLPIDILFRNKCETDESEPLLKRLRT